jgi:NAD(P)-dependent dehydrogenase (short-subunit alcohol dehydrogenase family)
MLTPQGRVVMISGAARGIGRAIADVLLAEGYTVSLGVRDAAAAARLGRELGSDTCLASRYDADAAESAASWVTATVDRFGRLDGVVANAGIRKEWDIEGGTEDDLDAMWTTNLKGPWRLVAAAWEHLKAGGSGRVVTMASMSGVRVKSPATTGYAITKFALMGLTHGIRRSGWQYGIRATAVCPSFVATDMSVDLASVSPSVSPSQMTQPETVARAVSFALALPNDAAMPALMLNCVSEP